MLSDSPSPVKSHFKSRKLFKLWRSFDFASAMFSLSGIIFATIDYEINYSFTRNYYNCEVKNVSYILKYLIVCTTFIAIVNLLFRYNEKLKWKRSILYFPNTQSYISGRNKNLMLMIFEIFILCIFPYPHYEKKVLVPIRFHFDTFNTCYNLSEILYCLMFLRVFFILRAFINFSSFQNDRGRRFCQEYGVNPNIRFLIKCLVTKHPIYFISGIAILSLFILSLTLRIFERPVDDLSLFYYSNPMDAIWCMIETMMTMGYGDCYPITYPGRIISVGGYCAGSVIFTLMIVSLQKNVILDKNQKNVFKYVIQIPHSALIIKSAVKYYVAKKKLGKEHPLVSVYYLRMKNNINNYKAVKTITHEKPNKNLDELKKNILNVKSQVKLIDRTVSDAIISIMGQNN